MSRIIAAAAIRGAHKIVDRAENSLTKAIEGYGKEKAVEFPNTGYFLPVIYGMTRHGDLFRRGNHRGN